MVTRRSMVSDTGTRKSIPTDSEQCINVNFIECHPVDDVDESEAVVDNPDTPSELAFDPVRPYITT
jgi:hypothetical protein